jgi:hypothetical protein
MLADTAGFYISVPVGMVKQVLVGDRPDNKINHQIPHRIMSV